jgi:Rab-GTPase-TBC domain
MFNNKQTLSIVYKILLTNVNVLRVFAESQESSNMYFCFRWLLILFKREFSFPDIMRLWEVSDILIPEVTYQVLNAHYVSSILDQGVHIFDTGLAATSRLYLITSP